MTLGSTQPLTKMSTRTLSGVKERPARKADNFTAICEPTVYKMWQPRRLTTLWASTACYWDSFTITYKLSKLYVFSLGENGVRRFDFDRKTSNLCSISLYKLSERLQRFSQFDSNTGKQVIRTGKFITSRIFAGALYSFTLSLGQREHQSIGRHVFRKIENPPTFPENKEVCYITCRCHKCTAAWSSVVKNMSKNIPKLFSIS
jgi:hypothetical protein